MSGGVIIARNLWDDAAFQDEPFSEREAWVWMICEAQWKPRQKRVGKVIVNVDRGQLAHSTRFLSEAWKWSHAKVRRFLDRLENLSLIRRETDTGVSVITLCKYNEYQLSPQSSGTEAAQKRHRSGTNHNKDEIREEGITEAKASDGAAVDLPPAEDDFASEVWTRGLAYLVRKGIAQDKARSFIGKLRKDHSDAEIFRAFSECSKAGVVDPIPWITKALQPRASPAVAPRIDLSRINPDGSLKYDT